MITPLLGTSFIGYSRSTGAEICGHAEQPGTSKQLEPAYLSATPDEVERAMALAAAAFPVYSNLSGKTRAGFLRAIASEIEGVVERIIWTDNDGVMEDETDGEKENLSFSKSWAEDAYGDTSVTATLSAYDVLYGETNDVAQKVDKPSRMEKD